MRPAPRISRTIGRFAAIARSHTPPRIYHLTPAREMRFAELRSAIEAAVPLAVKFSPDMPADELPDGSRVFDRVLEEVRSYLAGDLVFDRTNTTAILPRELAAGTCDLPQLVASQLARGVRDSAPVADEVSSTP